MKKNRLIPILGLIGSTIVSSVLIIFVLAEPVAKLLDLSISAITWAGLSLLFLLHACRFYLIMHGRDFVTNLINNKATDHVESGGS